MRWRIFLPNSHERAWQLKHGEMMARLHNCDRINIGCKVKTIIAREFFKMSLCMVFWKWKVLLGDCLRESNHNCADRYSVFGEHENSTKRTFKVCTFQLLLLSWLYWNGQGKRNGQAKLNVHRKRRHWQQNDMKMPFRRSMDEERILKYIFGIEVVCILT